MSKQELQRGIEQAEILTGDEKKLAEMLGGLRRVEAPGDFDMHLKAKIARGRAAEPRSRGLFPALRYAAPLSAVLVLAGFVGFSGILEFDGEGVPAVAQESVVSQPETDERTAITEPSVVSEQPAAEVPAAVAVQQREVAGRARRQAIRTSGRIEVKQPEPEGGSKVETLKGPVDVLLPRGFEAAVPSLPAKPDGFAQSSKVTVREVLSLIGIDAEFAGGGWKVRSAAAESVASRAGIKAGDVIESLDGAPLAENTVFTGNFTGKSMKVIRGGSPVTVELRQK